MDPHIGYALARINGIHLAPEAVARNVERYGMKRNAFPEREAVQNGVHILTGIMDLMTL